MVVGGVAWRMGVVHAGRTHRTRPAPSGAHKRRPYEWLSAGVYGGCRAGHRNCTAPGPCPTAGAGSESGKTNCWGGYRIGVR